jgi:PKD repeat protein
VLRPRLLASLALSAASIAGAPTCQLPEICDDGNALAAGETTACVQLNHPPTASILVRQRSNVDGLQHYTFTADAHDPDLDHMYYEWDFDNDGRWDRAGYGSDYGFGLPTAKEVEYVYPPGRRTVRLRVTDFPGLPGGEGSVIATATFTVFTPDQYREDQRPVASFTFSPPDPGMREIVSFDGSASFDPDLEQPIRRYEWDFGGTKVSEDDPFTTFQFPGPGDYAVSLRVVSAPFITGDATLTQTVHVTAEAPPRARLSADNTTPLAGQVVTFDASQTGDADGDIATYEFDPEGDSVYQPAQASPTSTHRYTRGGQYRARVRVTDAGGRIGLADVQIRVEGGEGPTSPGFLGQSVKSTTPPVPFSVRIGEKTLNVSLLGAKRSRSPAVRALLKFAKARWRSDVAVKGSAAKGTLTARGVVAAITPGKRPRILCLKVKGRAKRAQPLTGTMRILGGTGPGATLRGSFTFRAVQDAKGLVIAVGEARPVAGKKRPLPKRCAELSPLR